MVSFDYSEDFEKINKLMEDKLAPYLENTDQLDKLKSEIKFKEDHEFYDEIHLLHKDDDLDEEQKAEAYLEWINKDEHEEEEGEKAHVAHVKQRSRYEYIVQKQYLVNFMKVMTNEKLMQMDELLVLEPLTEFRRFIANEFMETDLLK